MIPFPVGLLKSLFPIFQFVMQKELFVREPDIVNLSAMGNIIVYNSVANLRAFNIKC